ncbi:MAG: hypothetical protein ACRD1T_11755, partial [Acidimicrobiia bacterium]
LLLWLTRGKPILFGAIFAIGFLNREFTIYGLSALLVIELANGSLIKASNLQHKLLALISFAIVWDVVGLVKLRADSLGPGTVATGDPGSLGLHINAVVERVGWKSDLLVDHFRIVFTENLPALLGGSAKLSEYSINSSLTVGLRWLIVVWVAVLIVGALRLCYLALRRRWPSGEPSCDFCVYLILVGAQSALVYAVLGQDVGWVLRYMLLSLWMPVGLVALYFKVERSRPLGAAMVTLVLLWAAVSLRDHVRVLTEYVRNPPPGHPRVMADYLVANHIEHGRADYWDAYRISFLAREQVMLASTGKVRVARYQRLADEHRDTAVEVSRLPCRGGRKVSVWYVCPP